MLKLRLDEFHINLFIISHNQIQFLENQLLELAHNKGIPIVATNSVLFAEKAFAESHDVLSCIGQVAYISTQDRKKYPKECYFKTSAEMQKTFSKRISNCITRRRPESVTNINIKNSFFTISFDAAKQKNFNKLFIHITQNPLNFKLIDQNKIKIKSKYNCCKDVLKSSVKDLITDHTITL